MKKQLYKQINIWKKMANNELICYRVFERLKDNYFAVQSADSFHFPIDENLFTQFNKQLIELLLETDIEEREDFYPTIEDAINTFDNDFL